jgi:23S rRNA (adenine2503-C2)-methyltransferase
MDLVLEAPARRGKPPRHLADLTAADRRAAVEALGERGFRADQLSRHYFGRLEADVDAMTDLPAAARQRLRVLLPPLLTEVRATTCDEGETRKSLWRLHDGALVESVTMRYPDRVTLCVSSQAGCGMACPFCATGQGGLRRNLSAAEIVDQVIRSARELQPQGRRVANVVFMGMGEPLANPVAVETALHRLADEAPAGFGMSARQITVSTVGLVPAIDRLASLGLPVRLAVSLHAPDDELRNTLVPINTRWSIEEVLSAAWRYADRTRRRVSIEYALIRDINDSAHQARALATLLRGHPVHVNLIPLNPTPGSVWTASRPADERAFAETLRASGITTTVRDTRGREIAGACGQLAATG